MVTTLHLRVAVADDLLLDRQCLLTDLDVLAEGRYDLEAQAYASGDALLADFAPGMFHLIFMDIYMDGINGLDAAREVRKLDPHCLVVFLTSSQDFAWQAFPLHPFDYLVKPYRIQRLQDLLDEALRVLTPHEPEVDLRLARHTYTVPLGNILYAVADKHRVSVMTTTGAMRSMSTYHDVEELLIRDSRFLVCNRGLVVNMEAIVQFGEGFIRMSDGKQFAVRQRSKTQLFTIFTQYQFVHMKKKE